jgi:site-specific recombinase XerD
MFHHIFKYQGIAARHLAAPLLEQRVSYLNHRASLGAAKTTLRIEAGYLLAIIECLELAPSGEVSSAQLEAAAQRWSTRTEPSHRAKDLSGGKRLFLTTAKNWLGFLGRWQPPAPAPCPEAQRLAEFLAHLERERGWSPSTIRTLRFRLEEFLRQFCAPPRGLADLTAADLEQAVTQKFSRDGWSRISLRDYASTLRTFFRYAETRSWSAPGLADSIASPRIFQGENLPLGPAWADVQRLLASVPGKDRTEIRDRAVLLLFAVYGLRASEVRRLKLEDLDWQRELLLVRRSKQQARVQTYPLAQLVGDAILRYLKEARPSCSHREVFLSAKAPIRPVSNTTLWRIVGPRLRALDLPLRHVGPHALRHACATHLLAEGLTMKEIGDHLGHRSADATAHYARVDLNGLREVADFDLGGLL